LWRRIRSSMVMIELASGEKVRTTEPLMIGKK
jgi:hypothetical protein